MNLRSTGPPDHPVHGDINRALRDLRRETFDFGETPSSPISSQGSTREEIEPMATFGDYGKPEAFMVQSGIKEPTNTTSFQIHPQFKRAVKELMFSGLDHECPLDHLENFMEECKGASNNQVDDEYVYMKLFHHTLAGNARRWLRSLTPDSLTSWEEVTSAFLEEFYPEEKSYEARRRITLFAQEEDESLAEAWARFRDLTRKCPHHKMETGLRIGFFYDGLDSASRAALDSGAGGSLRNVALANLETTISRVVKNCPSGSRRRGKRDIGSSGSSKEQMAEMARVLVKELGLGAKTGASKVMSCDLCGMDNHTRDYCGGRDPEHVAAVYPRPYDGQRFESNRGQREGFHNERRDGGATWYKGNSGGNQGNFGFNNQGCNQGYNRGNSNSNRGNFNGGDQGGSYVPPNARTPTVTFAKEPLMLKGPNDTTQDSSALVLQQFQQIQAHMQQQLLAQQQIQLQLKQANERIEAQEAKNRMLENQLAQIALEKGASSGALPQNPAHDTHSINAITLRSGTELDEPDDDDSNVVEELVEKEIEKNERQEKKEGKKKQKEVEKEGPGAYVPPMPYPYAWAKAKTDAKFEKFKGLVKELHVQMPLLQALADMPDFAKFMKHILSNKKKMEEADLVSLFYPVNAIPDEGLSRRKGDPGRFALPVEIGDLKPMGALADLGAGVNLMPASIACKLDHPLVPTKKVIHLADGTPRVPIGELIDIPIKLGPLVVPCDFIVMDVKADPITPLILGREVLKALGTEVRCKDNSISMEVEGKMVIFESSGGPKGLMIEKSFKEDDPGSSRGRHTKPHDGKTRDVKKTKKVGRKGKGKASLDRVSPMRGAP